MGALSGGAGNITGVTYETSENDFKANLIPATGATLDYSGLTNPIATGNTLTVIAQDGTTSATYTITVDTTDWAQGTIDNFTPDGKFTFHTSDFLPDQNICRFDVADFRDAYPGKNNQLGSGNQGCLAAYPSYFVNMSVYTTPGEYDFYFSYCKDYSCGSNDPVGDYYRTYFDGTVWSALAVDSSKTRLSNDAEITPNNSYIVSLLSPTYTGGVLTSGTGSITNIRLGTSKNDFEAAFTPATYSTLDFSKVHDPVLTGDTLVATAQNGIMKATYIITVDTTSWLPGTIISYNSAGKFSLDTSFFTDNQSLACNDYIYNSLYPFQANPIGSGSFPCGGNYGYRPVYVFDMGPLSTVGDYAVWLSDPSTKLGRYYQMHFDGKKWSSSGSVLLSNDDTVTSSTYTVSALQNRKGNITNVPHSTTKAKFLNALKLATGATLNSFGIENLVVSGDTLMVTAQDGITKATYTVTVNSTSGSDDTQ